MDFISARVLRRYGRVICCIGVNPNKRYEVSPQTRAQILRDMLVGSAGDGNGTSCDNVQVEGTNEHPIEDLHHIENDCNGPRSDCFGNWEYIIHV